MPCQLDGESLADLGVIRSAQQRRILRRIAALEVQQSGADNVRRSCRRCQLSLLGPWLRLHCDTAAAAVSYNAGKASEAGLWEVLDLRQLRAVASPSQNAAVVVAPGHRDAAAGAASADLRFANGGVLSLAAEVADPRSVQLCAALATWVVAPSRGRLVATTGGSAAAPSYPAAAGAAAVALGVAEDPPCAVVSLPMVLLAAALGCVASCPLPLYPSDHHLWQSVARIWRGDGEGEKGRPHNHQPVTVIAVLLAPPALLRCSSSGL